MTEEELRKLGVVIAESAVEDYVRIVPDGMAIEDAASCLAVSFLNDFESHGDTREKWLAGCLAVAIVKLAEERRKNCARA